MGPAGCGVEESETAAARPPSVVMMPAPRSPQVDWVETFDNRGQLRALSGSAVLDSNRGRLTLPVDPMPRLEGSGDGLVVREDEAMSGRATASDLQVAASEAVAAPDGIELLASDTVRIDGLIRAGPGGLVAAAGQRIEVNGLIESEGPVELIITEPGGEIVIEGSVISQRGPTSFEPPRILVRGRGRLVVRGQLGTRNGGADEVTGTPEISISLYGDVIIEGPTARVGGGTGGRVELVTTGRLVFADESTLIDTAAWTVGAEAIQVGARAHVQLGRLTAVAETRIELRDAARLGAGGDFLALTARTVSLGPSSLITSTGADQGTSIRLRAAERLVAHDDATVQVDFAWCGPGGEVAVRIAGPYQGLGLAAFRGAVDSPGCETESGSRTTLVAREVDGISPNLGPNADARPQIERDVRVAVPATAARVSGRWESRPFSAGLERRPRLTDLAADIPSGSRVGVALGVADGPDGSGRSFVELPFESSESLEIPSEASGWAVHDGADWLVIRIDLQGRLHDVPSVDHLAVSR